MNKHVFSYIVLLFFSFNLTSQNLSHCIVSVQGGSDKSQWIIIDWTLGENITETVRSANNIFTQGFHQPHLKTLKIDEESSLSLDRIRIYPNPVNAILHIQLHNDLLTHYNINLFDSNGKFIKSLNVSESVSIIPFDLSDLSSGIYLLRISDVQSSKSNSYRVIKN